MSGRNTESPEASSSFQLENFTNIDEPSPLDRILSEGRSYNGGNWTSDELKHLFDGVHKYGTGKGAMNYISRNLFKTRNKEVINAKVDEIREIIKESKEIIMPEFYKKKWVDAGHQNIVPPADSEVDPNEDWSSIIDKVMTHHHSSILKQRNPVQDTFEKLFENFSNEAKVHKSAPVTSMETARASKSNTQDIRWSTIYQFMKACSSIEDTLPAVNELEAAVILKVLDSIEDEASLVSNSDKALMAGIFTECQLNDFRFCEQDVPSNAQSALQLFVDPLRTRAHGVPEVAAEVEVDDDQPSTSSN